MSPERVSFTLNRETAGAWIEPNQTLLEVLRDTLGRTEVKAGCGEGVCGTCTVLLDGEPINSCLLLAIQAEGHVVLTLAGMMDDSHARDLQEQFIASGAVQCGFWTPGILLTTYHFLRENRHASRAEVADALSGNLCRCTRYVNILDAIERYQAGSVGPERQDSA